MLGGLEVLCSFAMSCKRMDYMLPLPPPPTPISCFIFLLGFWKGRGFFLLSSDSFAQRSERRGLLYVCACGFSSPPSLPREGTDRKRCELEMLRYHRGWGLNSSKALPLHLGVGQGALNLQHRRPRLFRSSLLVTSPW